MLNLGTFEKDDKTGKITGILYGVNMYPTKLIFEPAIGESGKTYFKIYAQCQQATVEAGAAWPKVAQNDKAKPYLDIKLNSPGLATPLFGKLFESDVAHHQYHFLWNEPKSISKNDLVIGSTQSQNFVPKPSNLAL